MSKKDFKVTCISIMNKMGNVHDFESFKELKTQLHNVVRNLDEYEDVTEEGIKTIGELSQSIIEQNESRLKLNEWKNIDYNNITSSTIIHLFHNTNTMDELNTLKMVVLDNVTDEKIIRLADELYVERCDVRATHGGNNIANEYYEEAAMDIALHTGLRKHPVTEELKGVESIEEIMGEHSAFETPCRDEIKADLTVMRNVKEQELKIISENGLYNEYIAEMKRTRTPEDLSSVYETLVADIDLYKDPSYSVLIRYLESSYYSKLNSILSHVESVVDNLGDMLKEDEIVDALELMADGMETYGTFTTGLGEELVSELDNKLHNMKRAENNDSKEFYVEDYIGRSLETLDVGNTVTLNNVGTFTKKEVEERTGKDSKGKEIVIPKKRFIDYTMDKNLEKKINS